MASQEFQSQPFHWQDGDFDDNNFQIRGRTIFFIVVLLAVVLLMTLIFLYARWVHRFGPLLPDISHIAAARFMHAPRVPASGGLDPAAIDSLPVVLHRSSTATGEAECCICLGMIQDGDKVTVLPECLHNYHSECVDKWLSTQSNCPLCRASLQFNSAS